MSFFAAFIYRQFIYEPPVPTASFKDKIAIVTGASSGLGLEACRWMVRLGASQVILACRNVEKAKAAANDIQATTLCSSNTLQVWHLDMSSYTSVQAFSDRVKGDLPRLDSLLAFLLLPKLRETAAKWNTQTYFTVTASELYEVAKFTERKAPANQLFATLNDESKARMFDRYNVSKLLAIFIVKQNAFQRGHRLIVNCVAPGFCQSELHREYDNRAVRVAIRMLARPTEVGARTLVHGASVGPESHGQYVPDCKITTTAGLTKGEAGAELQNRVWSELRQKLEAIRPGVTSLS
ncbi:MAG: hypothetical protein Q9161_003093 [Pseudevernia consocians]